MKKYLVSKYLTLSVVIFRKPVLLCMAQWVFWINFQMVVLLCWYNTCTHAKRTCMYNFLLLFVWIVENKLFFSFWLITGKNMWEKIFDEKLKARKELTVCFLDLSRTLTFQKVVFICSNESRLKWWKMLFTLR